MLWTISSRAIASMVGFFLGWTLFQVVRPAETLNNPKPPSIEVRSITIKHEGCADAELKCRVNDVTFHSNGRAVYVGYANDDYIGKFGAIIDEREFEYLVEQLHKQRFFDVPQQYPTVPAEEEIALEVVTNNGLYRVATHHWRTTPMELRILHALIDEQVYHVEWAEAD
jgi:hypothetical protein